MVMGVVDVMVTDGVARVVLNRPPVNVLDLGAARALADALEEVKGRTDLAAVVLVGHGKAFCAGVDVRDHLPDRGAEMIREFHRACGVLLEIDAPVVAMVHGAALGGGCELALLCDVVVAATAATFGVPEIKLGVFPPVAAVALARITSPQLASEMVLSGRTLTAAEAERAGIVNRVTPEAELEYAVNALARTFRSLSHRSLRVAKRALRLSRQRPTPEEIAESERLYLDELLHDPDAIEGLQAFLDKRPPQWSKE
jgi:cyclohexa-1,5-dienecarbonyl-CoA hydratase